MPNAEQGGQYRCIVKLAQSATGAVFLAVARSPEGFQKLVVLKELKGVLTDDPEFLSMFLDEARLSAKLEHPNVVRTVDVGFEDQRYFIAMEYLEGVSLRRLIDRLGTPPLAMQLHCIQNVLEGLHYAHELRDVDGKAIEIVHRDVSPNNVLVTYDGMVKIADFGTAKAKDSSHATRTGLLRGRAAYMAPEQPNRAFDRRADIFSVGVMLWEAIAGTRMWGKRSEVEILRSLALGDVTPIASVKPDAPPELRKICDRALATNPDDRYPTAAAMAADLATYIEAASLEVTSNEIGSIVARSFERDRARVRAVIEEQMKAIDRSVEDLPEISYGTDFQPRVISQPLPQPFDVDPTMTLRRKPFRAARPSPNPLGPPSTRRSWKIPLLLLGLAVVVTAALTLWGR